MQLHKSPMGAGGVVWELNGVDRSAIGNVGRVRGDCPSQFSDSVCESDGGFKVSMRISMEVSEKKLRRFGEATPDGDRPLHHHQVIAVETIEVIGHLS